MVHWSTDKLPQRSAKRSVQSIESLTYPHNSSSYPESRTQKRQDRPPFSGNLPLSVPAEDALDEIILKKILNFQLLMVKCIPNVCLFLYGVAPHFHHFHHLPAHQPHCPGAVNDCASWLFHQNISLPFSILSDNRSLEWILNKFNLELLEISIPIAIYWHLSFQQLLTHFSALVLIPIFSILMNNFPCGIISNTWLKSIWIRTTTFPLA